MNRNLPTASIETPSMVPPARKRSRRARSLAASFPNLIEQLYGAALDSDGWHPMLESLRMTLNASVGLQHVWKSPLQPELSICVNADPAEMQKYLEHYHRLDPWMANSHRVAAQSVAQTADFLPEREFNRSEFCNDFLLPQGFYRFVTAMDEAPPNGVSCVSFLRSRRAREFGTDERELLRQLLPHFRNSVRIARQLQSFQTRAVMLESALDHVGHGVVLLDGSGRVLHCNRWTAEFLRAHPELRIDKGMLELRNAAANGLLQKTLAAANRRDYAPHTRRAASMVFTLRNGSPVRLLASPFLAVKQANLEVTSIVFMTSRGKGELGRVDYLREVFSLTQREASCALLLVEGLSIQEIAGRQSITLSTARAHLRSLFAKTGVKRQGSLIALLARELAAMDLLME